MANTRFGITSPEKRTTNGGVDADRVQTCNIVDTVRIEDRKSYVSTLAAGIGTRTTDEITGGVLREVSWADRGDGFSEVTGTYRSSGAEAGSESGPNPSDPEEEGAGDRYSYSVGISQEPLLSHPIFADTLTDEELLALKALLAGDVETYEELKAALTTPLTTNYAEAERLIKRGEESYYAPTINVTISGVTTVENFTFPRAGEIVAPPGIPATFGDNQNYLFAGANIESLGNGQANIERTYLGSGRGGWNPTLYSPPAP
jgi:hypothetical protein